MRKRKSVHAQQKCIHASPSNTFCLWLSTSGNAKSGLRKWKGYGFRIHWEQDFRLKGQKRQTWLLPSLLWEASSGSWWKQDTRRARPTESPKQGSWMKGTEIRKQQSGNLHGSVLGSQRTCCGWRTCCGCLAWCFFVGTLTSGSRVSLSLLPALKTLFCRPGCPVQPGCELLCLIIPCFVVFGWYLLEEDWFLKGNGREVDLGRRISEQHTRLIWMSGWIPCVLRQNIEDKHCYKFRCC